MLQWSVPRSFPKSRKATTANPNAAGLDAAAAALADRIRSLKDAGRRGLSRREGHSQSGRGCQDEPCRLARRID